VTQRPPSEYEKYLRVPELLALQKPGEIRAHHDELLFQIVHQVEELWMKLALEEVVLTRAASIATSWCRRATRSLASSRSSSS